MTQFGFNGGSGVGWNQARFASIYDLDAQQLDAVGTIAQPTLVAPDPATLSAQSLAATGTIGQPTVVVGVVPAQSLSAQTLAGASTIAHPRCLRRRCRYKGLSAQTLAGVGTLSHNPRWLRARLPPSRLHRKTWIALAR